MKNIPDKAITHSTKFHADDVFSAALLRILNPHIEITRTLTVPEDFDGIVFDIGFGKYDHHQKNAPLRENGIPYAAFGLLWRQFGGLVLSEKACADFDDFFVSNLDLEDNTGKFNPVSELISAFNPVFDSDENADTCFFNAVDFAKGILEREFKKIKSGERATQIVLEAVNSAKDKIVALPLYCPWKKAVENKDILFMVYPSKRGGFAAQAVQKSREDITSKCPFPAEWAGKPADEIRLISGIETIKFCHNNCFLITADTLEDCIKACNAAIASNCL